MITLTVLGVLFAFTMPILNHSYQKGVMQTSFVDMIKEINKGIFVYSYNQQGNVQQSDLFANTAANNNNGDAAQKISTVFSAKQTGTNCWDGQEISQNFDESGAKINFNNLPCFIDGDNIIYATETFPMVDNEPCNTDMYDTSGDNPDINHKLKHSCGILYVDLNGVQSPNAFGKDVFAFIITNIPRAYLYPVGGGLMKTIEGGRLDGVGNWTGTCNENNKDGRACAGRIVEENMKMKYWK